jgi:HPt (histidine-containing phosphotransfer) domain-containing protein
MDWSRLVELRSYDTPDGAVVRGAISAFVGRAAASLAEVTGNAAERDGQGLRRSAHALKGAATNIGAVAVADYASRLEQAGKQQSFEEAGGLVGDLSFALVQTLVELHQTASEAPQPS